MYTEFEKFAHHIRSFWSYLLVFMSNFCHVHICTMLHTACTVCAVYSVCCRAWNKAEYCVNILANISWK